MHRINPQNNQLPLLDQQRTLLIPAPAERQHHILLRLPPVPGDDGPQPLALVQNRAHVLEVLELLVAGRRRWVGEVCGDLLVEAGVDVRAPRELEEDVAKERGGGVAAGEEDAEGFGADFGFVGCLGDEFAQEEVAGLAAAGGGVARLIEIFGSDRRRSLLDG